MNPSPSKQVAANCVPRVDVLIALSHLCHSVDVELAKAVPGAGCIVGGHSHTELAVPQEVNGVIIVQAHEYANNPFYLEVEDGKIEDYTAS